MRESELGLTATAVIRSLRAGICDLADAEHDYLFLATCCPDDPDLPALRQLIARNEQADDYMGATGPDAA